MLFRVVYVPLLEDRIFDRANNVLLVRAYVFLISNLETGEALLQMRLLVRSGPLELGQRDVCLYLFEPLLAQLRFDCVREDRYSQN